MGAGDYNGKNYGGCHTGRGDFRKGGPYSNNGKHYKRVSHRAFKPGLRVSFYSNKSHPKTAYEGVVVDRVYEKGTVRHAKSFIPVKFDDEETPTYLHKKALTILGKDNSNIHYNVGDKVVYTNKQSKLNGYSGKVVDKPEDKQSYVSFVQIKVSDKFDKKWSCYVHKNMLEHHVTTTSIKD